MSETSTALPSLQPPPDRTYERSMLERGSGIKPWQELVDRVAEQQDKRPSSEKAEPRSRFSGETRDTHSPNSLKDLTREQRAHWRTTGDLPEKKKTAEPNQTAEPESKTTGADGAETDQTAKAGKTSEQDREEWPTGEPPKAETSQEDRNRWHEKSYSDFLGKAKDFEPEYKNNLMAIKLDTQRGAILMHALADCSESQRRHVAKVIASRPDLQLDINAKDATGHYVYRHDEVFGLVKQIGAQVKPVVKPKPEPVTKAPKPVSEVGGRGAGSDDPLLSAAIAAPKGKLTREFKEQSDRAYRLRKGSR
jgi:hypothetical protein